VAFEPNLQTIGSAAGKKLMTHGLEFTMASSVLGTYDSAIYIIRAK